MKLATSELGGVCAFEFAKSLSDGFIANVHGFYDLGCRSLKSVDLSGN
jgi:hypothetical protein